jgi:hypothetical protein
MRPTSAALLALLSSLILPLDALARIKLTTLPVRERVEIQLEHPTLTLVEEERVVPLVQGVNQVDFSWANTRIDSGSILFRLVDADDQVKVLSVSYPPNENALVWSVSAKAPGPARVRIGYLLGGLGKSYHYRAVADREETHLTLLQYLRLDNASNESYASASLNVGFVGPIERPVGIDETKELLLKRYDGVPIRKRYTADVREHGYLDAAQKKLRIPMFYVLRNSADQGLGQAALPFGKARIFQQDGKGGTAFVGEDWARFTPRDDELALYLGVARDIVVKRTIERSDREEVMGNLFHQDLVVKYEIENFKDRPVTLDIVEHVGALRNEIGRTSPRDAQWELVSDSTLQGPPDPEYSDYDRLVFHTDLPARSPDGEAEKITHRLHLRIKNEW